MGRPAKKEMIKCTTRSASSGDIDDPDGLILGNLVWPDGDHIMTSCSEGIVSGSAYLDACPKSINV